jgi:glycosyltransferase involved in cell wall biosynthesis
MRISNGAESNLLHSGFVASVPFGASLTSRLLTRRVAETLVDDPKADPNITVVIRALNEAAKLEQLFEDIGNQIFENEIELIVVDNESTDGTPEVAKSHHAVVVTLPRGSFSYPKALNVGMAAASNELVFLTNAHVLLSNALTLHAGARHFVGAADTGGAFGSVLPAGNASYVERLSAMGTGNLTLANRAHRLTKAGLGALAATGAMVAKEAWRQLGRFDERYQSGGEDTALAKLMIKNGWSVVEEPALTVHHSHGLGLADNFKQYLDQLKIVKAPRQLDKQDLLNRRPDLRVRISGDER